jgi:branched-chain amino acid transport system ATP-binding protein
MLLEIANLRVHYDKIEAVKGVNLSLRKGEIVTLIGANGAGKTSILKAISGLIRPSGGQILYDGQDITRHNPSDIVSRGISHVPEGRRMFKLMSVEDNLRLGSYLIRDSKLISEGLSRVYEHFPILREKRNQLAGELSGGQQQMVAIGRAMMARPKVMLMDEPSLGLAPIMVDAIAGIITMLKESGLSIILVEQNAHLALKLADTGFVLETGAVALSGNSKDLLGNPEVIRAYLGA